MIVHCNRNGFLSLLDRENVNGVNMVVAVAAKPAL
jgi:hypothetical protein